MVRSFLIIFVFLSYVARADMIDFGSEGDGNSKIKLSIDQLKSLEMKDSLEFEEVFNKVVRTIELAIEEEKLYCAGEAVNKEGKSLPPGQKQFCMRELKKQYLESAEVIFEVKKKYLTFLHQRQLKRLAEIQTKLKSDIEKNF